MCGHHFPGNYRHFSSRKGVHGVVNLGGIVKTLRRSNSLSRSVFSTAGSFGLRSGPLHSKHAAFCVCVLKPTKLVAEVCGVGAGVRAATELRFTVDPDESVADLRSQIAKKVGCTEDRHMDLFELLREVAPRASSR